MIKDYAVDNAQLLKRAAEGDADARNELIVRNMGLVHSVVKRFLGRGYERDDLFQVGCLGLIRAAERFEADFGVKFSTYAVPMIIGEIKRFIRDDGIIKVSRGLKEIATKAVYIKEHMIKETGREPSVAEIAAELGISSAELAAALDSQRMPQSIYATIADGDGEGRALIEKVESDKDELGEMLNRVLLEQSMSDFCERDRQIIYLRYFRQKTQTQVAEQLGISQVQVSRLEKKILLNLRTKLQKNNF
ncbi:MAG: SigF/SigG family RNA polymerase sporulation sigma factor [Clostridia bacterium]|nr:SigF/SigG family RNA polymerase sporulation sigma factor [Clostridia bacterium]